MTLRWLLASGCNVVEPAPDPCAGDLCVGATATAIDEGTTADSYLGRTVATGILEGQAIVAIGASGYGASYSTNYARIATPILRRLSTVGGGNGFGESIATMSATLAVGAPSQYFDDGMGVVQVFDHLPSEVDYADTAARAVILGDLVAMQSLGSEVRYVDTTGTGVELVLGSDPSADVRGAKGVVHAFDPDVVGEHSITESPRRITGEVGFGVEFGAWDADLDGLDDLVVRSLDGCALFVSPWVGDRTDADADARLTAPYAYGLCEHTEPAGDLDGDGTIDLALGTRTRDDGASFRPGAVFVAPGGVVPSGLVDDLPMRVIGDAVAEYLGTIATSWGDVDGDGLDDLVVGASGGFGGAEPGTVYGFPGPLPLATLAPADAAFAVTGDAPGDLFGYALTVYDADGDGHDDVLVGSPGWDLGRGRAILLDGDALH